jgi:hypothetical protein
VSVSDEQAKKKRNRRYVSICGFIIALFGSTPTRFALEAARPNFITHHTLIKKQLKSQRETKMSKKDT